MQIIERFSLASYRNNWERQLSSEGGLEELPREDRWVLCIPSFIQQTAVNFHFPGSVPLGLGGEMGRQTGRCLPRQSGL